MIEVVVALAIAAFGIAAIVAASRGGLSNASLAQRYEQATRRAQTRLAEIGVLGPLTPGEQAGDDGDGFQWHSRVAPPALQPAQPAGTDGASMPALYDVEVDISWQQGGRSYRVELDSQRFATVATSHG